MRWRPRPIQPTLTDDFAPVIVVPTAKPSRFVRQPAARVTAQRIAALPEVSTEEVAMRAQIRADQAIETAAYLAEQAAAWAVKRKRLGL